MAGKNLAEFHGVSQIGIVSAWRSFTRLFTIMETLTIVDYFKEPAATFSDENRRLLMPGKGFLRG
jgi:hypothetical protein